MDDAIAKSLVVRNEPGYQLLSPPKFNMATLKFCSWYSKDAFKNDMENVSQDGDCIGQSNSISLSPI